VWKTVFVDKYCSSIK